MKPTMIVKATTFVWTSSIMIDVTKAVATRTLILPLLLLLFNSHHKSVVESALAPPQYKQQHHHEQLQLAQDFVAAMEEQQHYGFDSSDIVDDTELQRSLLRAATRVRRRLDDVDDDDISDASSSSIDLTKYALKYIGCSNIHTWDDEAAAAGATAPFTMDRFVVLRLCEASSCSSYNKWGCNYNYGEYMIPMETYLELLFQHHVTQFGYYCRICSRCMTYKANVRSSYNDDDGTDDWASYSDYWATTQANDDAAAANNNNNADDAAGDDYYADDISGDDDAYGYNQRHRRTGNNYYYNDDDGSSSSSTPFYIDATNGTCLYDSVCSRYKSACSSAAAPSRSNIQQYFSCQQFAIGNSGSVGYLGPHCKSDGRSMDIGFYADEYCHQFLGETQNTNIKTYLDIQSSDMDIYAPKSCIPCHASDSFALLTDAQIAAADDDTTGGVYSLCSALYEPAAKCQRAFGNSDASYQSSQQLDNEDTVCDMIESLVTNSYDEFGDPIVLEDFDYHYWTKGSEYVKLVRKATPFQVTVLVGSISLVLALFVYAAHLHRKLVYRMPWTPPLMSGYSHDNNDPRARAGKLSRDNSFTRGGSGILANRTGMSIGESSQTGGEAYVQQSAAPPSTTGPSVMA